MIDLAKILLGINLISLRHLVTGQPHRFLRACRKSFSAANRVDSNPLSQIPEISLDDLLGNRKPAIAINVMRYEEGMLPTHEAMALIAILVAESPPAVLEIGTFMGHTTTLMAENVPSAAIHTVDLPQDFSQAADPVASMPKDDFQLINRRSVGREFRDRPCRARITQHFSDTARWNFQEAGQPAFFFIDGSHTYEYCNNDTQKALAIAAPHSVFLWHDCNDAHPGVVKSLLQFRRRGMDIRRITGTTIAYCKS